MSSGCSTNRRTHLTAYRDAGVVGFLFGGGAGGVTCACDAASDGVSNPAPIAANATASEGVAAGTAPSLVSRNGIATLVTPYAADDDGGFFRWKVWAYYHAGALSTGTPPKPPHQPAHHSLSGGCSLSRAAASERTAATAALTRSRRPAC